MEDEQDILNLEDDMVLDPENPDAGADDQADEIVLEGEEQGNTDLPKHLRGIIREQAKRLAQYQSAAAPESEVIVGDYPTLEGCEYDEDKHREAVLAWDERRRAAEAQSVRREQAARDADNEGRDLEVKYRSSAAKLAVAPERFQEADSAVRAVLPQNMQAALAKYTTDPAKVVLALHKYPNRLDAIVAEPDPVRQLLMLTDIERSLKMPARKAAPSPEAETIQRGTASLAARSDKQAEKLLADATRTGNMTAYNRYMKGKKAA